MDFTQEQIEAVKKMFLQDGWFVTKRFFESLATEINNNAVMTLEDERALYRAKGVLDALGMILNYEAIIKSAEEAKKNADI